VPGATEAPRRNTYFSQKWSKMGTWKKQHLIGRVKEGEEPADEEEQIK
jgi:hypothetical protein